MLRLVQQDPLGLILDVIDKLTVWLNQPNSFTRETVLKIAKWQKWLAKLSAEVSAQNCIERDNPSIENQAAVAHLHNTQQSNILPHQITLAHSNSISEYLVLLPTWNGIVRLSNAHGHRIVRVIISLSRMPTFHKVIGITSSLSCYP